ncbi:unnamed protein product [Cylicocyclus nassatus]|uniref:Uncharacterized protein n=1 Tax=Cylicocyclus nassatus TaxID=53992 RepID=A0AA36DMP1_CYLNA|nr:unnamed protein product [Cylicocyclus nassatus]
MERKSTVRVPRALIVGCESARPTIHRTQRTPFESISPVNAGYYLNFESVLGQMSQRYERTHNLLCRSRKVEVAHHLPSWTFQHDNPLQWDMVMKGIRPYFNKTNLSKEDYNLTIDAIIEHDKKKCKAPCSWDLYSAKEVKQDVFYRLEIRFDSVMGTVYLPNNSLANL